ncbi:MAG: sulfonate transport system substrate-binding protein [Frankiaceae bacterium]|nr:sulfonate transport system substrate-binding protein [Frankiaceae bacterium]
MRRTPLPFLLALPVVLAAAGCGGTSADAANGGGASSLRLGYFANVTHAAAVVGVAKGFFQHELGSTKLQTQIYTAGPAEVTALLGGSLDAAFVGPNPAINAYVKSNRGVRLIAGAALGGAALVVKPSITSAAQLTGKTIATPQLGNTQDVALRTWLNANGHHVTLKDGDVTITPTDNATSLQLFQQGRIDGAWVPEPWVARLVQQGGGHVLVDEKTLWPQGKFATTELIVTASYLAKHPAAVKALLAGELDAVDYLQTDKAAAQQVVNDELQRITGKALKPGVISAAFDDLTISVDPAADTLQTDADHGYAAGTLPAKADLHGLVDLTLLNQLLSAAGKPTISTST